MIREICGLIYIGFAGMYDLKRKTVPILLPVTGFVISIILFFCLNDFSWGEMFLSIVPGIVFLILAVVMSGAIGIGDGIVLITLGLMSGFSCSALSSIYAVFLSGLVALGLLIFGKKKVSYQLPFLPFLVCGFILFLSTKN